MDESRKRRILKIGAVLIAVISLLTGGYFTLRKGVYLNNEFFRRVSSTRYEHNRSSYIELTSQGEFRIVTETGEKAGTLRFDDGALCFTFSNGTSLTGVWNGEHLTAPNGMPLDWGAITISVNNRIENSIVMNNEPVGLSDAASCQALARIYFGAHDSISAWPVPILGLLIYLYGVLGFLYPDKMHFLFRRWIYDNAELSEGGRLLEKAGAALTVILGVLMMTGAVFFLLT
ncbi:MAG: hypothetical protein NC432_09235 [Roseburia sp.]|nr:hypothetical protein [Roseburia sp.]MCM1098750.1 hypothetical protein [Ruminococcus flavefaciens]